MLSLDVQYAVHDWNDMEDKRSENYDREYQERFEWGKSRRVSNLKELSQVAHAGGGESTQIFDDLIKHRQWLAQKNKFLTQHSLSIVTNEVRPNDA
jgi:hypothetical protein